LQSMSVIPKGIIPMSIIPVSIIPKGMRICPSLGDRTNVACSTMIGCLGDDCGGMIDLQNPFRYGKRVTGSDFVDREDEIKTIVRLLASKKSVVLYSPRRMGKSSLLAEIARRYRKDFIFTYLDLYGVTSKEEMMGLFAGEVVRSAYSKLEKFTETAMDLLKTSSFRLGMSEKGTPVVEYVRVDPPIPDLREVFDIAEKVALRRKKQLVIIFDEFQEVGALDGVALLKIMRSRFQTHENVTYVFSGSKRHLLMRMFEEPEAAFFKFARSMELGPIPRKEFRAFLTEKFRASGGSIDSKSIERILDASKDNPYYVQHIAFELFLISNKPKWPDDVENAISSALEHQSPALSFLWDSVKSPLQRRYLLAVAAEPGGRQGADFVQRHRLRSASNVQKVIKNLDERGITDNGEIVDPMFVLWLQRVNRGT
jgi:AAA+ ATPase superfamily predicted ATPase